MSYRPRPGSAGDRALEQLGVADGRMSQLDLADAIDVESRNLQSNVVMCIQAGLIKREVDDEGVPWYSLGDGVPLPPAPEPQPVEPPPVARPVEPTAAAVKVPAAERPHHAYHPKRTPKPKPVASFSVQFGGVIGPDYAPAENAKPKPAPSAPAPVALHVEPDCFACTKDGRLLMDLGSVFVKLSAPQTDALAKYFERRRLSASI